MTEKTWGVRLNQHSDYWPFRKGQRPPGCPDWFESPQISRWQYQGLVIWDNTQRRIETLDAHDALRLLDKLSSHNDWKTEGVSITRLVYEVKLPAYSQRRHKKTEPESEVEAPKGETVYREIMHLPPEAGSDLIELLQTNQDVLSEMAEQEKKCAQEAMSKVWDLLQEIYRKKEESEIDFKARPFEWRRDDKSRWTCQYQSAEGRIWLGKSKFFLNTCVKRTGHITRSNYFMKLLEAVEWAEKELVELVHEPELEKLPEFRNKQQKEADRAPLRQKLMDGPYWIDPSVMEPKQTTYQIFIELDVKPIDFKTYESICGDIHEYDHRYLSPVKMASAVNLDFDRFKIDQPFGERSERFRITSLTTYYQETATAEQAQKTWDESNILQQFKEGKIRRARYGYKETETGFAVFLGACEDPNKLWEQAASRNDWMEIQALKESLSFALDVADYRDYLGISAELISDEQILAIMHATRTRSRHLPEEIRRESKVWLAEHEPIQ